MVELLINLTTALFGGLGGAVRSVIGFVKTKKKYGSKFDFAKMMVTVVEGFVLGVVAGQLLPHPISAFMIAYGGTDFIDNIGFKLKK